MYHARNKGILKADGDIIGFLNCDDLLNNDALQIIANSFIETPGSDMIFGITRAINVNNEISEKLKWGAFNFNKKKYFNRMLTLPDQSTFFNARVFSIIGLFNTDYKFGADTEIKCRVIKKNLNIKQIPDTIAFWRLYEDTLTHRPDLKWERLFEAIKINRIYNRTYFTRYNTRLLFNYLFFDEFKKNIKKILKK
jgi:glycosyltransferase involved in cell wall biosynthesis